MRLVDNKWIYCSKCTNFKTQLGVSCIVVVVPIIKLFLSLEMNISPATLFFIPSNFVVLPANFTYIYVNLAQTRTKFSAR